MDAIICAPELNLTMMKGKIKKRENVDLCVFEKLNFQVIQLIVAFRKKPIANLLIFW